MPNRARCFSVLLAAAFFSAALRPAIAWDGAGHEIIALVAWQNLSPQVRDKISTLLRTHPDYDETLTKNAAPAGPERDREAFLIAATWPDIVRTPGKPQYRYNHPQWHYVDFPFVVGDLPKQPDPDGTWKPGTDPANALQAFGKNLADLKDGAAADKDRAIALCWIEHLVGDIHQPLHATSLFDSRFPNGDHGGNNLRILAEGKAMNFHSFWDEMLGTDQSDGAVSLQAGRIMKAYPPADLHEQLAKTAVDDFPAWAHESFDAAKETAYLNGTLPSVSADALERDRSIAVPPLPAGYMAKAMTLADQRVALAGYRLAALLDAVFAPAPATPNP